MTIRNGQVLAVVDMGSNSFRLEMARLEHGQLVRIDYYKEPVRLGAGLDANGNLTPESIQRSVECLQRFSERLQGVSPTAVRAIATQSLRSAKNPDEFLKPAQEALGYPIDIIAGQEEARLIYLGVSHDLPKDNQPRLVVDIGGGSTELIVGTNFTAHQLKSLRIGCVSHTLRFFPDGRPTKRSFEKAVIAASAVFEEAYADFGSSHWEYAVGSSGTIEAVAQLCMLLAEKNGESDQTIYPMTRERMSRLAKLMLNKEPKDWSFSSNIREQRAQVLAGGLAVLMGLFAALDIKEMRPCDSALRQGAMLDLLEQLRGTNTHYDVRKRTMMRLMKRYSVDFDQAQRVQALAMKLYRQLVAVPEELAFQHLSWAALAHEVGMAVSHDGYQRHGAYLMANTDLAGFSRFGQSYLAHLIGAQVGGLRKHAEMLEKNVNFPVHILCLRLAVILAHARVDIELPQAELKLRNHKIQWSIEREWHAAHPLASYLIDEEWRIWERVGYKIQP